MTMRKRPGSNPLALAKLIVEIGTKQVEDSEPEKLRPSARKR